MDFNRALTVIDAVMDDNWADLTSLEIDEEYEEAADVLYRSGQLATLPGRYGRIVEQIMEGGL